MKFIIFALGVLVLLCLCWLFILSVKVIKPEKEENKQDSGYGHDY